MHGNKDWMSSHWCLSAIIFPIIMNKFGFDKIHRMASDFIHALIINIFDILVLKMKGRAKSGTIKFLENIINALHISII